MLTYLRSRRAELTTMEVVIAIMISLTLGGIVLSLWLQHNPSAAVIAAAKGSEIMKNFIP